MGSGLRRRQQWSGWRSLKEPAGESTSQHPALHPVPGPRLPMSQCQLLTTVMPEDEEGGSAHQGLQAQDQWWLSCMQAAHCFMLLSCQALSGEQVSRSLLSQHQAQTSSAAVAAQATTGSDDAPQNGHHGWKRYAHAISPYLSCPRHPKFCTAA